MKEVKDTWRYNGENLVLFNNSTELLIIWWYSLFLYERKTVLSWSEKLFCDHSKVSRVSLEQKIEIPSV